ncbi:MULTISPECIES: hypothetical protein [Paenibacillus]|uniref:Uncharacterized protein n=1 Tax=Paenibacillus odorifer TaxID=189426 RepID=A0ABX3HV79_9BACL|nr:hypothetical protein [Paenibacillus odorifer]OMD55259.1 hypothetical protein BSK51_04190 [Paenibacillus odorifer]
MALTKFIHSQTGMEIPNAYIVMPHMEGGKELLKINVKIFISREAYKEGKVPVEDTYKSFVPSVEEGSGNYHKQSYEYLKTLPEYAGAIDVLE